MVLLELSIFPMDKGASVSPYVARCIEVIESSGLDYRAGAMGTTIEGELPQLLDLMQRCFDALAADCDRIYCLAKFDYRKAPAGRITAKVESLERHLGRSVKR